MPLSKAPGFSDYKNNRLQRIGKDIILTLHTGITLCLYLMFKIEYYENQSHCPMVP